MSKTKPYKSWLSIRRRCFEETFPNYNMYGGRGITMQESWKNDFMNFYNYVGDPPDENSSIDRIDNDGDYCEGNVKWASSKQQTRNKGLYSNNTTGVSGVHHIKKKGVWYYIAVWVENGRQTNRVFSVNKYGLLPAMAKAIHVRKDRLEWLKKNDGYSDKHGEPRKDKNV